MEGVECYSNSRLNNVLIKTQDLEPQWPAPTQWTPGPRLVGQVDVPAFAEAIDVTVALSTSADKTAKIRRFMMINLLENNSDELKER